MKKLPAASLAAFSLVLGAMPAGAAQTWPRHLVYKVEVTTTQETDQHISQMEISSASNTEKYSGSQLSHGTMEVSVSGFTPDKSLEMTITENTDNRRTAPITADVAPDGSVRLVNNNDVQNITDEEQMLLRTLAQQFVTPDDVTAVRWQKNTNAGVSSEQDSFEVKGTDPSGFLKINYDQRLVVKGAQPFDMTSHGTLSYDMPHTVPHDIVMQSRMHQEALQSTTITDEKYSMNLMSDSFQTAKN
ncbi:MAG: hypothetical protein JOZ38_02795 [Candidatus Eremiobacteraeota bacterium]|nr:hypothetical protein [Candidatus Eremiobacteraeota bacterium]